MLIFVLSFTALFTSAVLLTFLLSKFGPRSQKTSIAIAVATVAIVSVVLPFINDQLLPSAMPGMAIGLVMMFVSQNSFFPELGLLFAPLANFYFYFALVRLFFRFVLGYRTPPPLPTNIPTFRRIWWRSRAVKSSENFTVNLLGVRRGIEYREGSLVYRLRVEPGTHADWIIYINSLKQISPSHINEIPAEEAQRIKDRVASALNFMQINFAMN
jgi:hypothetical protein